MLVGADGWGVEVGDFQPVSAGALGFAVGGALFHQGPAEALAAVGGGQLDGRDGQAVVPGFVGEGDEAAQGVAFGGDVDLGGGVGGVFVDWVGLVDGGGEGAFFQLEALGGGGDFDDRVCGEGVVDLG